jgi:glutamate-1-semialdehyde aminotransferase
VVIPDPGYLAGAHALLKQHKALLIADEARPPPVLSLGGFVGLFCVPVQCGAHGSAGSAHVCRSQAAAHVAAILREPSMAGLRAWRGCCGVSLEAS